MSRTVLALDQSTSSTKALLFDEDGRVLDRESLPHQQHYPQPGWVEHDAEEIWQNTLTVLRVVATRAHQAGLRPLCLSLTNQRETLVVFDRRTGRPLHRALVWQDRRGDALCAAQAHAGREEEIRRRTGLRLDAYFSGSKAQWLVQQYPDLAQRLASGEAVFGTIDTYLIHRLTEGRVFATDPTNASRTLFFDLQARSWHDALCRYWQVPRSALPEVRDCSSTFGSTTLDGTLAEPVPIQGVMGDSQAALFAHRCFDAGSVKATFGTGTSVLLSTGAKPQSSEKLVTALGWVLEGQPAYTLEGIIISSGATLTWLVDQLQLAHDTADLAQLAAAVPDSGGVYLVPAFSGLGLPHWRPDARAAIVGLSSHSDRRHLARAALESIGFQLSDALEALQNEAGVSLRTLHADGGATENTWLMQWIANLTGLEVRVPSTPECSPLGVALLGFLGRGVYRSLDEIAALRQADTRYVPMSDPQIAAKRAGWRTALAQVLQTGLPLAPPANTTPAPRSEVIFG